MLRQVLCVATATFVLCANIAQATEKGLFWKMESPKGVVSFLFGTIHSDDSHEKCGYFYDGSGRK